MLWLPATLELLERSAVMNDDFCVDAMRLSVGPGDFIFSLALPCPQFFTGGMFEFEFESLSFF